MTCSLTEIATHAYVYGVPLVDGLDQVRRFATTGVGANPAADFNTFSHARTLAGVDDDFVSINNDTVYSIAQLDLSAGPLVLEVPDTAGRYHVLQFVSAWTENFAYVGTRATGSGPGRYLIAGPSWQGEAPPDVGVIQSPTVIASIVGRWAVKDHADLDAVHQLQDATTLTAIGSERGCGLPDVDIDGLDEALAFWERYRVYSRSFAPPDRDRATQDGFARLGLAGTEHVSRLSLDQQSALREGYQAGAEAMQALLRSTGAGRVNGWQVNLHAFDYNLDHYQIGALDDPRFTITDPQVRLLTRAGAARAGLWGTNSYEALYFPVFTDADGNPLTGAHDYELTLDPPPPAAAFWSITMYDAQRYLLVANTIGRYSIGDRTPGLVHRPDGALTIRISATAPQDGSVANWLPAPTGQFRPMLRVYLPGPALLDGT